MAPILSPLAEFQILITQYTLLGGMFIFANSAFLPIPKYQFKFDEIEIIIFIEFDEVEIIICIELKDFEKVSFMI